MRKSISSLAVLIAAAIMFAATGAALAEEEKSDRHAGYYYPPITSSEVYEARAAVMPDADRSERIGPIRRNTPSSPRATKRRN